MSSISFFILSLSTLLLLLTQPHPLFFALGLLIYSLLISFSLMHLISMWLGLSLTLIFMGGMMVIILYVSALASEYKFSTFSYMEMVTPLLLPCLPYLMDTTITSTSFTVISSLYLSYSSFSMLLLLFYLLLTLIIVVMISESYQGPVTSWN